MVNEKVLIRDKHRNIKKSLKIILIILLIIATVSLILFIGFSMKPKNLIYLENPLKEIVFANTNEQGLVNKEKVVEQAVLEFNPEYINYLIIALGANNLHKSYIGYGNPIIEMNIEGEIWTSELSKGNLLTDKRETDEEDLRIKLTKNEGVEALLSLDIKAFMKNSVINGNTQIEMVAGKIELGSKGYLTMYQEITGKEISLEESLEE